MSGLFQRLFGGHSAAQDLLGTVVQSSIFGLPIPVIYGQARVGGNLIHLPKDPVKSSASGGGKFGRTKGAGAIDIYTAPIAIALGEAPAYGIGKVWADKDEVTTFAAYIAAAWAFFDGSGTQTPWSYLTTNVPAEALTYPGIVYVAHPALDLPGYHLRNYSWELVGALQFGGPNAVTDASPKDVLNDILTHVEHGFGWKPFGSSGTLIGDLTVYGQYCAAAGLFVSPAYASQKAGLAHVQELMDASNAAIVWSDGLLKVVPYGDVTLTANGQTYTPNTTPLYDLSDTDFLAPPGEDPVKITRKPSVDAYNQIVIEFEDRANDYNPSTAEAKDQAAIETVAGMCGDTGLRPAPKVALPLIKTAPIARTLAQLRLQREQNVRNEYRFTLGLRHALLEPMDLVTLTDPNQGLNFTPVRMAEVIERADEQGIDCIAEDWPFGTASATLYPSASGVGYGPQATTPPGNTTTPVIFDGPFTLAASPLELWIAASGGPKWGGCEVWYSVDNVAFYKVGVITSKAIFGTLTAALATNAALPATDSTHTLAVDLTPSSGALASVSAADFAALTSLCYVDGEFLAFQTAALTSAFHYNLTTLGRGAYKSPIAASHLSGTQFVLCDQAVYRLPFPQGRIGQTVYFKFPAFNQYGGALQDISGLSSVSFVIGNIPGEPIVKITARLAISAPTQLFYDVTIENTMAAGSGPAQTFTISVDQQSLITSPNTDVTTSLAPGATFTQRYTVNKPVAGGTVGAVTWTGKAPGWNNGVVRADISDQGQDASQPITIAIDESGSAIVTFSGGSNHLSWRYAYNSGTLPLTTPTDAAAAAGTLLVGRSGQVTLALGLTLGQGIILKGVPWVDAAGSANAGQYVTAWQTRQNKQTAKRIAFSGAVFPDDGTSTAFITTWDRANNALNIYGSSALFSGEIDMPMPDNVLITDFELYGATFNGSTISKIQLLRVSRSNPTAAPTTLSTLQISTTGLVAQLVTAGGGLSETVDNSTYRYMVKATLNGAGGNLSLLNGWIADFGVVYTAKKYHDAY